jgi:hypothetical protein
MNISQKRKQDFMWAPFSVYWKEFRKDMFLIKVHEPRMHEAGERVAE